MIEIRHEQPEDRQAIRLVNQRAFGRPEEANIVEKLGMHCPDLLSLVAEVEGRIVGHVLFSPATIEGPHGVSHWGQGALDA
jgi:putative acetyltransferase